MGRCWCVYEEEAIAGHPGASEEYTSSLELSATILREPVRKKIRDFLGVFPKCRTPPPPPFGNFDHFLPIFFGQVGNFWVILRCFKGVFRAMVRITKVLGMRRPPPLCWEKFPNNSVFFS